MVRYSILFACLAVLLNLSVLTIYAKAPVSTRSKSRTEQLPELIANLVAEREYRKAELKQKEYLALLKQFGAPKQVRSRATRLLADILSMEGKLVEAEAVCRESLALETDWYGKNQLVKLLLRMEKYQQAEETAEALAFPGLDSIDSQQPTIRPDDLLHLAQAQFGLRKFDQAKLNYERALGFAKKDGNRVVEIDSVRGLAQLYKATNRPDLGAEYSERANFLERALLGDFPEYRAKP